MLDPKASLSVKDKYLILSKASEAFDITSLRKIYFCVYRELIRISINLVTYVLNENVYVLVAYSV